MPHGLPESLLTAIERAVSADNGAALYDAARLLSDRYRAEAGHAAGRLELLAYLATRLPATYAAARAALEAAAEADPDFSPVSVLDVGAGPGTAGWAAAETFSSLRHLVSAERETEFVQLGQVLAKAGPDVLADGEWVRCDLNRDDWPAGKFDLVTINFALTELPDLAVLPIVKHAWAKTTGMLMIVEPGTSVGFARLARVRAALIADGADIAAPCPHLGTCPLIEGEAWCHMSVRLPRSRLHRQTKAASLAFEDEKFCYLAATRRAVGRRDARLLYPIRHSKADISAFLCRPDGQAAWVRVPARQKRAYKAAKKWQWGQVILPSTEDDIE